MLQWLHGKQQQQQQQRNLVLLIPMFSVCAQHLALSHSNVSLLPHPVLQERTENGNYAMINSTKLSVQEVLTSVAAPKRDQKKLWLHVYLWKKYV